MENRITRQIMRRTGARIKALEVEVTENTVVVRGCAPCHYVKQLALQGVFDVLGSVRTRRIELNVSVCEPKMSAADSQ